MDEGFDAVRAFAQAHPVLYAATLGLDKGPRVHPAELCIAEEDAFWFAVPKCERFYAELSLSPWVQLCVCDGESGTVLHMEGTVRFSEDPEVISRCLEANRRLRDRWGGEPSMLIAWFLQDGICRLLPGGGGDEQVFPLGTPANALLGIRFRKKKELRDRLAAILLEREAQGGTPQGEARRLQQLYDGALLYFVETAKALWPRMDIRPIERSALFETYDEREKFVDLAKRAIGNAVIDKPEDLTCWLSKETLGSLADKG